RCGERIVELVDAKNVAAHELDARVPEELANRVGRAEREVVEKNDLTRAFLQQAFRHVRAYQARPTRDDELSSRDLQETTPFRCARAVCAVRPDSVNSLLPTNRSVRLQARHARAADRQVRRSPTASIKGDGAPMDRKDAR